MSRAIKYLPLVGLMVGGVGSLIYWLCGYILPHPISIIISMGAMLLSTGAFHEDGFADMCDGFGGGYSRDAVLRIMKDSHIGTYGVLGLIFILLLRYLLLLQFSGEALLIIIIAGAAVSRLAPVLLVRLSTYAKSEPSKSSHSALGVSIGGVIVASIFALSPLLLIAWEVAAIYLGVMAITLLLFKLYIERVIGGFTGDTLGALQQIGEVIFYATVIATQQLL